MKHLEELCIFKSLLTFQALRCIGDLIRGHPKNLDALASKSLGEGPEEPALNSILRIILRTSSTQEFVAADYVFKSFCEVDNASFHIQEFIVAGCVSLSFPLSLVLYVLLNSFLSGKC